MTDEEDETNELHVFTEAVQLGPGVIKETGPYISVPVHLTHEGVANRGLKQWDQIYDPDEIDGVHSFEGSPVFRGHPFDKTDVSESLGRLRKVKADTIKKRADCEALLVRNRLTGKELESLKNGEPIAGSIGFKARRIYHSGSKVWDDGSEYDWEIRKPFYGDHYALLGDGDDPACKTCGFNMTGPGESKSLEGTPKSKSKLSQCSKSHAPAQAGFGDMKMAGIDPALLPEFKKLFRESLNEALEPIDSRLKALEETEKNNAKIKAQENSEAEKKAKEAAKTPGAGSEKFDESEAFKGLVASVATLSESVNKLNSSAEEVKVIKAERAALKEAAAKAEFGKMLNAANGPATPTVFEKNWAEAKADVLSWRATNPDKLLTILENSTELQGNPNVGHVSTTVEAARKKTVDKLHNIGQRKE
jgi:hypothetical protein